MDNNKKFQLKSRQICLFFIAFMPITKLFTMPSILTRLANNDLWISATINVIIDILTLSVLLFVSKKTNKTYYEMLVSVFGKGVSKAICLLYAIFFMFKSVVPIIEQKDYIDATLYISMPSTIYFLAFFIVAFYLCTKKLRILGRLADILFAFTLFGYIMLITLSINNVDASAVLPIGVNGASKIFSGSYNTFAWFGDAVYMMFFIGNFKHEKHDGLKIIGSYLINAIMIILFLMVFYCIFTSIAFRQRFALTEIAKYTTVISNTGRFDYFAIVSLLFSCIISASLPLFFASKIIEQVFEIKSKYIAPFIVVALSLIFIWIFNGYY